MPGPAVGETPVGDRWRAVLSAQASLSDSDRLELFCKAVRESPPRTLVPLLPLIFNLRGKPYTLAEHFPFETVYQTRIPNRLLFRTARQVAKTTNSAARGILLSAMMPYFSTLYVTPLFEQVRRFSTQSVRPFIERSPIKHLLVDSTTENSVLQKSFRNHSKMAFSFAYLDADRIRGWSSDAVAYDEIQDMDGALIPVIAETMSASKYRYQIYTGTPKGLDNTIEGLWGKSSQAEWCIPCRRCKKLNVPRMGYDLEKMLGPSHPGVGPLVLTAEHKARGVRPGVPGIVCAKCGHWLDPRTGAWVHQYPDRRWTFAGYHVPQCIMPMHCEDRTKWAELIAKRTGYGNTTIAQFFNEVLGEGYDVGSRLITKTDLQAAALLPWANDLPQAAPRRHEYDLRVLGVDWGGGGEDEISFTTVAVVGVRGDGTVDVLYGERLLTPHDHLGEAARVLQIFRAFDCALVAHDYNGAGNTRETILCQAGIPESQFVPFVYRPSARQGIVVYKPPTDIHPRAYWQLDKTRAITLVCQAIRLKIVRTFQYDYQDDDRPGLLHDFLALIEHKVTTTRGPEIYTIQRNPTMIDDFAHAVTFAACCAWHQAGKWPNLALAAHLKLTDQQEAEMYDTQGAWD